MRHWLVIDSIRCITAPPLQVPNLVTFCHQFIQNCVCPMNCLALLRSAMHFKAEDVVSRILQFTEEW